MKQRVAAVGVIFLILLVLSKSGVLDSLLMFVLVGAVPGTNWSLPAGLMLYVCAIATLLLATRYTAVAILEELDLRRRTRKYIARRERMPKKRFRSITH